jgi:hypothetical protein
MNMPVTMIVRDIARQGIEPTRRRVREVLDARHQTATDDEIDAALVPELHARWIVEPVDHGKAKTSAASHNARVARDRVNAHVRSNDPFVWDLPKGPKGAS